MDIDKKDSVDISLDQIPPDMKNSNSPEESHFTERQTSADLNGNNNIDEPLLQNGKQNADGEKKRRSKDEKSSEMDVKIELATRKPLIYKVSDNPPPHLVLLFGLQQSLLSISAPLSISILVSEVVCAQKDDAIKTHILSASFFMTGISTILMSTVGVRLPIFQGPASTYLVPLLAMSSLPEWSCPATFEGINPVDNSTVLLATIDNGTVVTAREIVLTKLCKLSGSLILAGGIHFLIGATGLVGILIRYIGPVTIVPTIVLVGLYIYKIIVKFAESSWLVAALTAAMNMILSLFLANKQTPIPMWSKDRGFHIHWFPLHQVFSVLFSMIFGWGLSAVLTTAGALTDDKNSVQYLARTDARSYVIHQTDWFIFPYPGKFGMISFSIGGFISFLIASILSVLDSIGDYNASARTARVPLPPRYAFNRGIAVEGLMSMLSGGMGCCHATVSYGGNIGAMGITRVVSRRVFQMTGLFYIVFAVVGKFGAVFITIPYAVLGGTSFVIIGIFVGVVLSYLQSLSLSSTRNLAIIGTSLLLGLMMPYWTQKNPDAIDTGNAQLTNAIQMLLSNPSFVGGFFACFLDNTVPGTLKERGLLDQMKELNNDEADDLDEFLEEGLEIYRLPFVPSCVRNSRFAKYIPILENSEVGK